jgi:tetratricopeptide (TPR) repeat protein
MGKICFVIMPFGGSDENKKRHFMGVYQSILKPAAEAAGYTVKRADIGREPGNITADIINDLASADMVIADLTGGNANVFFELGIRHVLRKSGTVHIVDRSEEIPFDVRQYRVVEYSTHLADVPLATTEIIEAIKRREDPGSRSDNPVHDVLAGLPGDFRDLSNDAQVRQVEKLREILEQVEQERDNLARLLRELDPAGTLANQPSRLDLDQMLDQAEEIMRSTGEFVMLRLRQVADEHGREAFVQELRSVVKSPHLSDNDFLGLAQMCRQFGLADHRRVVLEIAHQRFPRDRTIFLSLADAYDDSPAPSFQERGRLMLENFLHIDHSPDGDGPKVTEDTAPVVTDDALGLLFNFYFTAGRPDWVVSVSRSTEQVGHFSPIVARNLAKALTEEGRLDEAEEVFVRAIAAAEDSGTHQFYSDFLSKLGRHEDAYEQSELGAILAPSSPTAFLNLSIDIVNHQYIRTSSGEVLKVDKAAALRAAVPVILAAVSMGDLSDRERAVGILVRHNAVREAKALAEGNEHALLEGYDSSALDYVLERTGGSGVERPLMLDETGEGDPPDAS